MWQREHEDILRRRLQLRERCAGLRERLATDAQALEQPLALADKAHNGFRWIAARPYWLAALALLPALPVLLRPSLTLRWGLKLWSGLRFWRQVRRLESFRPGK